MKIINLLFIISALFSCRHKPPHKSFAPKEIQKYSVPHSIKGVALVVHGLNLLPSKMQSISKNLHREGILPLPIVLSGHNGDLEEMKGVRLEQWTGEIADSAQHAKKQAEKFGVPLYFIGYSLGALLILDYLGQGGEVRFEKMVLLAPALELKWYIHFIKAFYPLGAGHIIGGIGPTEYSANRGSSVGAYRALFELTSSTRQNLWDFQKLNIPTHIFIDPQDEVLSYQNLIEKIIKLNLGHWQIIPVKIDGSLLEKPRHHLILDEKSMGKEAFASMINLMINFLQKPL